MTTIDDLFSFRDLVKLIGQGKLDWVRRARAGDFKATEAEIDLQETRLEALRRLYSFLETQISSEEGEAA